jgi:hypothetical protein
VSQFEQIKPVQSSKLQKLQKALSFAASKIESFSNQITIESVRSFSLMTEKAPSTAFFKAGRCLCLMLKALTAMDEERNR